MLLNPFDDSPSRLTAKAMTTGALLVTANIAAWLWAWAAFSSYPALLGTALLAYMFGVRHAFDVDHIAAIDNVVRKLMREGKAPYSVGFFFSLGHSSIVVLASVAVALSASLLQSRFDLIQAIGGVVGSSVSAVFLLAIGLANVAVLKGIWRALLRARHTPANLPLPSEDTPSAPAVFARLLRPLLKTVSRSWHMYPVGFLFGLGFDTATEIGLLGISAMQAAHGESFWTILVFPALFTAGMSLMDTADSLLMTGVYGWAMIRPSRKLWYNLTITTASAATAIGIGGIEALALLTQHFALSDRLKAAVTAIDGNLVSAGCAIIATFSAILVLSLIPIKIPYPNDTNLDN